MIAWSGVVPLGLVLLVGCGGADRSSRRARESTATPTSVAPAALTAPSIVFLGTSLTAGLGVDPEKAYPALIQRRLDSLGLRFRVVNAGVSGESSAGALRRLEWILREPPAVLVVETGANDGLRGQDVDSLRANIQAIISRTRAASAATRIILVGMEALPNLGVEYTRRFRILYPELAKANDIVLIPFLLRGVAGVDSLNQNDGIHPTVRGHEILADNVWPVLSKVLGDLSRSGKVN